MRNNGRSEAELQTVPENTQERYSWTIHKTASNETSCTSLGYGASDRPAEEEAAKVIVHPGALDAQRWLDSIEGMPRDIKVVVSARLAVMLDSDASAVKPAALHLGRQALYLPDIGIEEREAFNEEVLRCPGLLGDMIRHAHRSIPQARVTAALAFSLVAAAPLVARYWSTDNGIGETNANIFTLFVGPTGGSKSATVGVLGKVFDEVGARYYRDPPPDEPNLDTYDPRTELFLRQAVGSGSALADYVLHCPAGAVFIDEAQRLLGKFGNTRAGTHETEMEGELMSLHGNQRYMGKRTLSAGRDRRKAVDLPCFSFGGATTTAEFNRIIKPEMVGTGLMPRLLTFIDDTSVPEY